MTVAELQMKKSIFLVFQSIGVSEESHGDPEHSKLPRNSFPCDHLIRQSESITSMVQVDQETVYVSSKLWYSDILFVF